MSTGVPYGAVHHAERDGVPVLWSPAPGPCIGALVFRTGKVDETLPVSGINHLVEHMALFPIGRPAYGYNGRVENAVTAFYAEGEPGEVGGFLSSVAATLADLPLGRLGVERRILLTEAQGRDAGLEARLLMLRFGPRGYGLGFYEELGLEWLDGADVQRWATSHFTRGNAVVWMTAEPPDDLALALPDGAAVPAPVPAAIPRLELPAELQQGTGGVALAGVAERSTALNAALAIAADRAHDRLRREAGLSYAVNAGYNVLDGRVVHAVLQADCRDHDAARVRDELLRVVDDLAATGPTERELEDDRRQLRRSLEDPQGVIGTLNNEALDRLLCVPTTPVAEILAERDALDAGAVAAALSDVLASLLALVPSGVSRHPGERLGTYAPAHDEAVEGNRYPPTEEWRAWQENTVVVVGREGVSLVDGHGEVLTVRFAECVALISGLSGSVTLVDDCGAWLLVAPAKYRYGDEAVEAIRGAVDDAAVVPATLRERELAPLVDAQLPAAWRAHVPQELDRLPFLLGDDERVELLARAKRGDQVGLLVMTDLRLLFLFAGARGFDVVDVRRAELRGAQTKGVMRKRLIVDAGDATHEFADVQPAGRLAELEAALAGG